MFGSTRRRRSTPLAGVRFCDSCARVSTATERAERRYDRTHAAVYPLISPR
ncbi:hypothetical protein NLX85_25900 [Micromonospora sp. A3M-1-15]|uniref:hypothetical protein n=1 Tax=Micromonospora sp. A3M-1-15 TaxID=2962035 RepID=UPI0020B829CB|nr:hypothetical protein [Micromonospora sp. A3M-1-15]MCP3786806.1 hypothetical protein [Micromonospora sp. A3M-1-15]